MYIHFLLFINKKDDIIFTLMGCARYNIDTLEELALDLLIDAL